MPNTHTHTDTHAHMHFNISRQIATEDATARWHTTDATTFIMRVLAVKPHSK